MSDVIWLSQWVTYPEHWHGHNMPSVPTGVRIFEVCEQQWSVNVPTADGTDLEEWMEATCTTFGLIEEFVEGLFAGPAPGVIREPDSQEGIFHRYKFSNFLQLTIFKIEEPLTGEVLTSSTRGAIDQLKILGHKP